MKDNYWNERRGTAAGTRSAGKGQLVRGAVLAVLVGCASQAAHADATSADIEQMKQTIRELQSKLASVEATQAQQAAEVKKAAAAAPAPAKPASDKYDGIQAGPLNIKFGGFLAAEGFLRNRNETSDFASSWNKIPYPNSSQYYLNEFRMTARQSRLSMLVSGGTDGHQHAEGYYEMDFGGAAQTANSNESNSYNPRVRHVYGTYYNDDIGLYILGGQTWSLATQEKTGMKPRDEITPIGIEGQYVPGFNWTRNAQIRFVEKFNNMVSAGLSFESPATIIAANGKTPAGVVVNNAGGSLYNSANNYTLDNTPDIIAKVAVDPGFGHYELYGMERWFRDRVLTGSGTATTGQNHTTSGFSVGGSLLMPLMPKQLELQASFLIGDGVGRYGSAQMVDATYKSDGTLDAVKGKEFLVGLVGHPTKDLDLYAYWGREEMDKTVSAYYNASGAITGAAGYGNPLSNLSGCYYETGSCSLNAAGGVANNKVEQFTGGLWWKFYRGPIGIFQVGLQGSYTKATAFEGLVANPPATIIPGETTLPASTRPDTNMTVWAFSLRYYPYAK
ncbi:MAG TPA: hypothetical protein VMT50_04695 [Steroidobacteraceae bacterium]|nr:hypothetical protein [Steroidobacteraceae bacterium]